VYVGDNDHEKRTKLIEILKSANGLSLVFVQSKRTADELESYLVMQGE